MAQKSLSVPDEGIIELYDVVDPVEDAVSAGVSNAPDQTAWRAEGESIAIQKDAAPESTSYSFQNIDDFLDTLESTPSLTLLPPKNTVCPEPAEATPNGEAEMSARPAPVVTSLEPRVGAESEEASFSPDQHDPYAQQAASLPDAPDDALVREFEAALAGAVLTSPACPTEEESCTPETPANLAGVVTPCADDQPHAEQAGEEPEQQTEGCVEQSACGSESEPEADISEPVVTETVPQPSALLLPNALSLAETTPAEEQGSSLRDEVEERFIRLEEALSRLNERVTALERHVADAENNLPELSGHLESLLQEGGTLYTRLQSLVGVKPEGEAQPLVESAQDDGPDMLTLTVESLQERVSVLENRPVVPPSQDVAGITQDVLALVRVDMKAASEETELMAQDLAQLKQRVKELEERPLPELILPELPDTESITAEVMAKLKDELDRVASESAARVLREEITALLKGE